MELKEFIEKNLSQNPVICALHLGNGYITRHIQDILNIIKTDVPQGNLKFDSEDILSLYVKLQTYGVIIESNHLQKIFFERIGRLLKDNPCLTFATRELKAEYLLNKGIMLDNQNAFIQSERCFTNALRLYRGAPNEAEILRANLALFHLYVHTKTNLKLERKISKTIDKILKAYRGQDKFYFCVRYLEHLGDSYAKIGLNHPKSNYLELTLQYYSLAYNLANKHQSMYEHIGINIKGQLSDKINHCEKSLSSEKKGYFFLHQRPILQQMYEKQTNLCKQEKNTHQQAFSLTL